MILPIEQQVSITVYPRYFDKENNIYYAFRRVLKMCSWTDNTISTSIKTGNILKEPFTARVFRDGDDLKYIPPHIWASMNINNLEKYWTVDLTQNPIIIPFENDYEFTPDTEAKLTTEILKFERENQGAVRIKNIQDNEGSRDINGEIIAAKLGSHILLSAG
jgi:hypothetical protein